VSVKIDKILSIYLKNNVISNKMILGDFKFNSFKLINNTFTETPLSAMKLINTAHQQIHVLNLCTISRLLHHYTKRPFISTHTQ